MSSRKKTVGIILCGSGYLDGSEIRESVAALWALSAAGVQVRCFAPDAPQRDVVNCLSGESLAGESRNMLVEAARIARGDIEPLSTARAQDLDALVIPGGFGAAKNLCDFALKGAQGSIRPELQVLLREVHASRKPIGAICIAPAILALAFAGKGVRLTVGASGETSEEIEKLGQKHVVCATSSCVVDEDNLVVTTPAYMDDSAPLHEIFEGIRKLVQEVVVRA
jgi:enhancing lycopene biosynthesis protein 2